MTQTDSECRAHVFPPHRYVRVVGFPPKRDIVGVGGGGETPRVRRESEKREGAYYENFEVCASVCVCVYVCVCVRVCDLARPEPSELSCWLGVACPRANSWNLKAAAKWCVRDRRRTGLRVDRDAFYCQWVGAGRRFSPRLCCQCRLGGVCAGSPRA